MNVVSLGDWLDLCRAQGVPYVPADLVGTIEVADLWPVFDGERTEGADRLHALTQQAESADTMLRWDCCASIEVKHRLGSGRPEWDPSFTRMVVDDPRFADILFEWPEPTLRLWRRPWIPARVVDGWPVEFRVFVDQGHVIGVSSYYPQRPLPDDPWLPVAARAARIVERDLLPAAPGAFTADFLLTPDDDLLFLEGGPPHRLLGGAHPCCFVPGHTTGVALADRNGTITPPTEEDFADMLDG